MAKNTGVAIPPGKLARLANHTKHISTIILSTIITFVALVALGVLVYDSLSSKISIDHVSLTNVVTKSGYTPTTIRSQLESEIQYIYQVYRSTRSGEPVNLTITSTDIGKLSRYARDTATRKPVTPVLEELPSPKLQGKDNSNIPQQPSTPYIDNRPVIDNNDSQPVIEFPGINISLTDARKLFKRIIRKQDTLIRIYIRKNIKTREFTLTTVYVDTKSRVYKLRTITADNIDELLRQAALVILRKKNPVIANTYARQYAVALYNSGKYRQAMRRFETLYNANKKDFGLCFHLARSALKAGINNYAFKIFRQCDSLRPNDPAVKFGIATIYTRHKQYDMAYRILIRLVKKYPLEPRYHLLLGQNLLHTAKTDMAASKEFRKAIELYTSHMNFCCHLGFERVRKELETTSLGKTYIYNGLALMKARQYEKARQAFNAAAKNKYNTSLSMLLINKTFSLAKKHNNAITYFSKRHTARSLSELSLIHYLLARNYFLLKKSKVSLLHANKAIALDKNNTRPYSIIGLIIFNKGIAKNNINMQALGLYTILKDNNLSDTTKEKLQKKLKNLFQIAGNITATAATIAK
jgi:tetratricopeptide (TPR) repeat protein